jgi:DNA-binding MarR family transcriptional regulator
MTGLIDRLERSGFVLRKANPKDRRLSHIHITRKGITEATGAKVVIHGVNEAIKMNFPKEEIESFKKILNGFVVKFRKA